MKIAIDIDDTLTKVDRVTAIAEYLKNNRMPFQIVDPDSHTLSGLCNWTYEDVTDFIHGGGRRLFTEAPLRDGAKETIASWKEAGHEIIILTARSEEWFGEPTVNYPNTVCPVKKGFWFIIRLI